MNILVVSDDHGLEGFDYAYKQAKRKYGQIDLVVHAGDSLQNEEYYRRRIDCDFKGVAGNCDFMRCDMPMEQIIDCEGHRIFVIHGDRYPSVEDICLAGKQRGADIVIYGHTHKADYETKNNPFFMRVNPGSLTKPRGGRYGSYAVITIGEIVDVTLFDMPDL